MSATEKQGRGRNGPDVESGVWANDDQDQQILTLGRALYARIRDIVGDPLTLYVDVKDFCTSAIRNELERAEKSRWFAGRSR